MQGIKTNAGIQQLNVNWQLTYFLLLFYLQASIYYHSGMLDSPMKLTQFY